MTVGRWIDGLLIMYAFDEFLEKHVILTTAQAVIDGLLVEHKGKDDIPYHTDEPLFCCILSTSCGFVEILDKDILDVFEVI